MDHVKHAAAVINYHLRELVDSVLITTFCKHKDGHFLVVKSNRVVPPVRKQQNSLLYIFRARRQEMKKMNGSLPMMKRMRQTVLIPRHSGIQENPVIQKDGI
jgi:hypothetical protein